ncbi:hypothetical protein [Nocardia australiensis]|uniref:hypothetical protein n=1 Tax=Nocardia australiensis TaxID=2887191 RepID=UPI001D15C877|nr:hypothetical protein [Nocardia australiensis]
MTNMTELHRRTVAGLALAAAGLISVAVGVQLDAVWAAGLWTFGAMAALSGAVFVASARTLLPADSRLPWALSAAVTVGATAFTAGVIEANLHFDAVEAGRGAHALVAVMVATGAIGVAAALIAAGACVAMLLRSVRASRLA